jgi:hypothetical protein
MPNKNLLQQIKKLDYKVFSCADLLNCGGRSYKSISKGLERLTKQGKIKRISEGLYGIPVFNDVLHVFEPFEKEDIVAALARKFGWKIAPAGVSALHALGLAQQVPNSSVYVSTGPYKIYTIQNFHLVFKHSFRKELVNCSLITNAFIQAIKCLGQENADYASIRKAIVGLEPKQRQELAVDMKNLPVRSRCLLEPALNHVRNDDVRDAKK